MIRFLVIGENENQAKTWAMRNNLQPNETRFTADPYFLRGLSNVTVFLLEGWEERKQAKELIQMIEVAHIAGVRCIKINDDVDRYCEFHPRAMKLIRKQKPFIVVAEDEPYYLQVYRRIRDAEIIKERWSKEDEQAFTTAEMRFHAIKQYEIGIEGFRGF